jgi:hypothetical protein
MVPRTLNALRQPEYTGENRCFPCTALNIVIASVVSVFFAVVWLPLGMATLAVSVAAIYLRGYLVPGTPTITSRYFPGRVLRLFDKHEQEGFADGGTVAELNRENDVSDTEEVLLSSGVIEVCEDVDDLCLTDGFRESWSKRIDATTEEGPENEKRLLAESIDVDADALRLEENGRFAVKIEGDRIASWKSHAAFVADIAAEQVLGNWCETWEDLNPRDRSRIIASLRVFLEECPSCGGKVSPVEEKVDTCCRKNLVNVTLNCEDCGDVVFEGSYR